MSDVWQGPGWWLASDGKWYPADAQPGGGTDPSEAATETAVESSTDTGSTLVADPVVPPTPVAETPAPAVPVAPTPPPEPVAAVPEPVEPPAPAPIDPQPAASRGGWQAVEAEAAPEPAAPQAAPPVGEWTEPAVAAADTPSLDSADDGWSSAYDAARVAEVAEAEVETIVPGTMPEAPRFEIPDVQAPVAGAASIPDAVAPPAVSMPDVAPPTIEVPNIPAADPVAPDVATPTFGVPDVAAPAASIIEPVAPVEPERRSAPEPLARDDAWRKPGGAVSSDVLPPTDAGVPLRPAPEVVDLAIPAESPLNPQWTPPDSARSPWRGILTAVLVLSVIVGLAIAIGWFFTRDSGVDATDEVDATPETSVTTDASAPTTAADATVAPTEDPTAGREVSVFELRAGDCIQGEIGSGQVQQLIKVDCSVPHEFEVYREALIDSTVTSFDEAAISAQAEEVCRTSLAAYIPPDDDRDLKFKWFQPTEESWNQETDPDRVITCLLFDEEGPLTGRAA